MQSEVGMKPLGTSRSPVTAAALFLLVLAAPPLVAQPDVRVTVPTMKDSRYRVGTGDPDGSLVLFTQLEGGGLESARAFRITLTGASDDTGRSLLPETGAPPSWEKEKNSMNLWMRLLSPARAASKVTVTGVLDLYVPSLDPAAEVKVENALARAGKPIVSKGLKAAKVEVVVAPKSQTPEGSIVLLVRAPDLGRLRGVTVVRRDGTAVGISASASSSTDDRKTMELGLSEAAPPDAALVFSLLTEKSVVSVPFELRDVPLP